MLNALLKAIYRFTTLQAVATQAGGCSGSISAEEALTAEASRYAALTRNDFEAMERLLGDELVYIHSSSNVDTKASFIESMRSGAVKYRKMTRGDVTVHTYGCIAIITGGAKFEVHARGQELALDLLFHSVWAKRATGVQFVSWQATRVPAQ